MDYGWLKEERTFQMDVKEAGFTAREVIAAGENLYDPQFGWLEEDGSITFSDIGGQAEYGWDPSKGHGAILSLKPDDTLEFLVPPENMGTYMPLCPIRAPANFGPYEGHMMLVGQSLPGRDGALSQHYVYKWAPGDDHMTVFAKYPHAGPHNDGIPGAALTGGFGPPGSPHDGYFFCSSMMNCTIYRVHWTGTIEPWITFTDPPIMPLDFQVAPEWWGALAGEFIMWGKAGQTFTDEVSSEHRWRNYHVRMDGTWDPVPIPDEKVPAPIEAVRAPAEFGSFGGDLFWVDEGGVDLNHVTRFDQPLPYSAKLMRTDSDGQHHVFADNFQGSSTLLVFDKSRLLMSFVGKSYSTGEYHHPDGSIHEIRYTG